MESRRAYYVFQAGFSLGMGFAFTKYVPWLREVIGLSQAEVLLLNAVFWLATFLLEVPTGMVADGRGRGFSLSLSTVFMALSGVFMFRATGFWSVLVGELLTAVGQAFLTGAGKAWLGSARDQSSDLGPTLARATQISKVAGLLGVLLGSWPGWGASGFWLGTVVAMVLTGLFVQVCMRSAGEEHTLTEWEAFDQARDFLRKNPNAHWNTAFLFLVSAMQWFNLGWAVVGTVLLGAEWLPVLWLVIVGPHMLGAEAARRWSTGQTVGGLLGALLGAWLPMICLMVDRSAPTFLLVVMLHEGMRGFLWPSHEAFQLKGLPKQAQATILSMYALAEDLGLALWSMIGWGVYEALKINDVQVIMDSWIALLAVNGIMVLVLWWLRPRD